MVPGGPLPERDLSRPISAEELGAFKAWAGAPPPDGWELETDEAHVKAYRHVEYFGTDNSKVAEYVRCECEVEAAAATTLALIREPDRRRAWDDIVGESLRVTQVRGHEFVSFSHDGLLGVGARSFLLWYGLQSFDEAGRECGPDSTAQTHVMMWCPAAVDWPGLPEPPEGAKRTKALAFAMVLVQDGERRRTRLTFAARACFPAGLLEYVVPSIMRDIMPKYVTRLQCAAAAAPEAEADRVAGPPQQQPSRRVQLHGPTRGPEVPRERPRQPPQAPQLPAPQQQAAPLPTGLGLAYIPPSRKSALAAEHLPDALSEDEGDVWGSSGAYECEFDCGFRGSFGEVAAHEGRCWRRRELTALARPEVARAARAELPGPAAAVAAAAEAPLPGSPSSAGARCSDFRLGLSLERSGLLRELSGPRQEGPRDALGGPPGGGRAPARAAAPARGPAPEMRGTDQWLEKLMEGMRSEQVLRPPWERGRPAVALPLGGTPGSLSGVPPARGAGPAASAGAAAEAAPEGRGGDAAAASPATTSRAAEQARSHWQAVAATGRVARGARRPRPPRDEPS